MGGSDRHRAVRLAAGGLAAAAVAVALATLLTTGGSHRRQSRATTGATPSVTSTSSISPRQTTSPATAPQAQPPPSTEQFGVDVGGLFGHAATIAQIDAQLHALRQTGATIARIAAYWEATEPTAPAGGVHRYNWTANDLIAELLAMNGLHWLPIIAFTAPWAQSVAGEDHSPPSAVGDYAAYAAALAARYGPGGSFWTAHPNLPPEPVEDYEIWNEPDNQTFWLPRPDAGRYAELYLRARDAITAVDPSARVIIGGLWHPRAFLPAMLNAKPDLRGHIDGVGIHPYGGSPEGVLANVRSARHLLSSLGLGTVPLYITEFGWTTRPPGALDYLPERLRPGYISRTIAALGHVDCGIAATLLFAWVTPERNLADGADWFGIHPPGGANSADTAAFAAGLREATTGEAQVPLCSGG